MTTEQVLERLGKVKKQSGGYMACCPAHDDKVSSLSVKTGEDGKTLLYCHAGCSVDDILTKIALEKKDLFSDNGHKPSEPIAPYDYTDATGKLLYQVLRKIGKKFSQRRPDGHGGWAYNLNETERVPYNLPAVIAAIRDDKPVFIVEGEKDCDRLAGLGLTATTNSGGAGKWAASLSKHFQGAKVVILPDNDSPGRDHARAVAGSLAGIAAVKIIELPGLEEKQDVSDWLDAGHDKANLVEIVKNAVWDSSRVTVPKGLGRDDAGLKIKQLADFTEPEAMVFVVEDFIPQDYASLIYGDGGQGKSYIALRLAMSVVTGDSFLEKAVRRGNVLYVDFELDENEQARRAYKVARGLGLQKPPGGLFYFSPQVQEKSIGSVNTIIKELAAFVKANDIALTMIDSFGAAVSGDPESAKDVTGLFRELRTLGTVLVIDHQAKPKSGENYKDKTAFGSVYKQNMSRNIWQLQRNPEAVEENEIALALYHRKSNFGPLRETTHLKATFGESFTLEKTEVDISFTDSLSTEDRVLIAFLELEEATAHQVSDHASVNLGTVKNKITALKTKGKIAPTGKKDGKAELYRPIVTASHPLRGRDSDDASTSGNIKPFSTVVTNNLASQTASDSDSDSKLEGFEVVPI